jgi:two-component system OmpR family response regulator
MAAILIVDDDTDTRELLQRYLQREGYHVLCASNGWEALMALESHVDLILLDVMMPGMDGITFLKILRNAQHKVKAPIILVTAMSSSEVEPKVRSFGVADILHKTQDLFQHLIPLVQRTLGEQQEAADGNGRSTSGSTN